MRKIEILGLETIPEIQQGDNLPQIICNCVKNENIEINEKDIIVLTSKIVTKSLGLTRKTADVKISPKAHKLAKKIGKDPVWVQLVFDTGHKIIAVLSMRGAIEKYVERNSHDPAMADYLCEKKSCLFLTRNPCGQLHTCDAGIDSSNHPQGEVGLIPDDPDEKAKQIRQEIQKITGKRIALVMADTELTFYGTMDLALGCSGINPLSMMFGEEDKFGKPKFGGFELVAHQLTAASALLFGQINTGIPVAIIRGFNYDINETKNVSNTLRFEGGEKDILQIIKETMRLTSYLVEGFSRKLLLRVGSWFIQ
ncbi:MAG: Coenzyme F420:L-glutamate ligase [Planctomycetes bacterium ADurb.Bin401]|nr:MAG: Coenzyme F420:L-glutamate ligase [Planctomycetes bacterium ADurb.Bin401]